MNILFMCVANSARSQLAEGLAKSLFGDDVEIESAGSKPSKVNPLAVEAMKEVGIDLSNHYSKTADNLSPRFLVKLDYVITLCAEEVCPVLVSKAKKLHWPMPDPAGHGEMSHEEQLQLFRVTREEIKKKLIVFKNELNL
jgi:arsenate reductase